MNVFDEPEGPHEFHLPPTALDCDLLVEQILTVDTQTLHHIIKRLKSELNKRLHSDQENALSSSLLTSTTAVCEPPLEYDILNSDDDEDGDVESPITKNKRQTEGNECLDFDLDDKPPHKRARKNSSSAENIKKNRKFGIIYEDQGVWKLKLRLLKKTFLVGCYLTENRARDALEIMSKPWHQEALLTKLEEKSTATPKELKSALSEYVNSHIAFETPMKKNGTVSSSVFSKLGGPFQSGGRWKVQLKLDGKNYNVGSYKTQEKALDVFELLKKQWHHDALLKAIADLGENASAKDCRTAVSVYVNRHMASDQLFVRQTSTHKGVWYNRKLNTWHAQFMMDGTPYRLGSFTTEEEAAQAVGLVYEVPANREVIQNMIKNIDNIRERKQQIVTFLEQQLPNRMLSAQQIGRRRHVWASNPQPAIPKLKQPGAFQAVGKKSWQARVLINNSTYNVGVFPTESDAMQLVEFVNRPEHQAALQMQLSQMEGTPLNDRKMVVSAYINQFIVSGRPLPMPSKYKGVSWDTQKNDWRARYNFDYIHCNVGRFKTEEEAHNALEKIRTPQHREAMRVLVKDVQDHKEKRRIGEMYIRQYVLNTNTSSSSSSSQQQHQHQQHQQQQQQQQHISSSTTHHHHHPHHHHNNTDTSIQIPLGLV